MIKSYNLIDKNSAKYIEVFLDEGFYYAWNINDVEKKFASIYFKEPSKNDLQDILNLSVILNKMVDYKEKDYYANHKLYSNFLNDILNDNYEDQDKLMEIINENSKEKIESIINEISRIIKSDSTRNEHFDSIQKFIDFINSKSYRKDGNDFIEIDINICFDNLKTSSKHFLFKKFIAIYLGFFLEHFPSTLTENLL